jgi:hypothetical protein
MKKLLMVLLISMTLIGCTERTSYGECIGFDEDEDPTLKYKVDIGNAVISIILFETIIVPIIWALEEAKCPVGKK